MWTMVYLFVKLSYQENESIDEDMTFIRKEKVLNDRKLKGDMYKKSELYIIETPGLTGGSGDSYIRHILSRARNKGWRVMVFISRGCAHIPVTTPQVALGVYRASNDLRIEPGYWALGSKCCKPVLYTKSEGEVTGELRRYTQQCNPEDVRVLVDGPNTSSFTANTRKKGLISRGKQPIGKVLTQAVRFGGGYRCASGKGTWQRTSVGNCVEVYKTIMMQHTRSRLDYWSVICGSSRHAVMD
ncbi:hypothetical protein Tco_0482277 [Tanacetum coccineum]